MFRVHGEQKLAVMTADTSILVNCIVFFAYMYIQIQHEIFVAYKILLERVSPIDTRILRFTPTTVKSLSVHGVARSGR